METTQYISDWTEENPQPPQKCQRPSCTAMLPYNLWKRNVNYNSANPNGESRHLCNSCYSHYKNKATTKATRARQGHTPTTSAEQYHGGPSNGVDVDAIHRGNMSARRPDYGHARVPVIAMPPPQSAPQRHAHNPYATGVHLQSSMPPPSAPAASSVNVYGPVPPRQQQYGYSQDHNEYNSQVQRYLRAQNYGTGNTEHTFMVAVQLFYAFDEAQLVGKGNSKNINVKRCAPIKNITEHLSSNPYEPGASLAPRCITLMEATLKEHANELHHFHFNLRDPAVAVRDPKAWTKVNLAEYDGGYFRSETMVKPPKKKNSGSINTQPVLVFKAPKEPPVLAVVVPYSQYQRYQHHVAEMELQEAEWEQQRQLGVFGQKARKTPSHKSETNSLFNLRPSSSYKGHSSSRASKADPWSTGTTGAPPKREIEATAPRSKRKVGRATGTNAIIDTTTCQGEGDADEDSDEGLVTASTRNKKPRTTPHRSPSVEILLHSTAASRPPTTGQGKKSGRFGKVDANALVNAMISGGSSKMSAAQLAKFRTLTDSVMIFAIETRSLSHLVELPEEEQSFIQSLQLTDAIHATISVFADNYEIGGFKTCHDAVIISSSRQEYLALHFGGKNIKAKRSYTVGKDGKGIKRLPALKEMDELSAECNTIYWATALLTSTYEHIDEFDGEKLKKGVHRPFFLPRLRFVKAALCCVLSPNGSGGATNTILSHLKKQNAISPSILFTYMLEETIPGRFVKYIHNGDPRPILEPIDDEYEIAEFLCFTQHLQYLITEKTMFLSDYQGADGLLTDPQILTDADLGADLFGLGNIKEGFECFERRHVCNRYCTWYELDPLDAEGESDSGEEGASVAGSGVGSEKKEEEVEEGK